MQAACRRETELLLKPEPGKWMQTELQHLKLLPWSKPDEMLPKLKATGRDKKLVPLKKQDDMQMRPNKIGEDEKLMPLNKLPLNKQDKMPKCFTHEPGESGKLHGPD